MLDSAKTKNVTEATNKPHLFEKLEDLQKRSMLSLIFDFHYTVFSLKVCAHYACTLFAPGWECVKKLLLNT